MEELSGLRKFYGLKKVERANSVNKRKESAAEHSWSCLVLADYFMGSMKIRIDRLKVYEMLLYHDLVEIETGDINILDNDKRKNKKEEESKAMEKIKCQIPLISKEKFVALFTEFEEGKTKEAKFSRAVDALDAVIHELDYKQDWTGWTEDFLKKNKERFFEEFPEMRELFKEILIYCKQEGYFK